MNNTETQAVKLSNQFKATPPKKQVLTLDKLKSDLANPKLHGKKVDLPLEWIKISSNHRSVVEDIEALKLQILEIGLAQPIGVQLLENEVTVVYGHRRLRAYSELCQSDPRRFSKISCMLQVYDSPIQGRIIAQAVENLGRRDLNPLDESKAINELKETLRTKNGGSYTNTQLGEFLGGIHRKTVDLAIIIANWPGNAHALIRQHENIFTISQLRSIAKKGLRGDALLLALKNSLEDKPNESKKARSRVLPLSSNEAKVFKNYINDNYENYSPEDRDFAYAQRKWLGSAEHREIMRKVLSEYFET